MSLDGLRARLIENLDPAADWTPERGPARSDYDLNPGWRPPKATLNAAAVLVPIIATSDGVSVLMTRRADTLASHTGQIAFPGGRLDPGETALDAALREAWEEVALDPADVEVLGLGDAYQSGTGFLITPVIGWLVRRPHTTPSPDEVAEVFEIPWDFLMDLSNHRRDSLERDGLQRWFWAVPYGERYVWGVTAGIIRGLRARLYGDEPDIGAAASEDAA